MFAILSAFDVKLKEGKSKLKYDKNVFFSSVQLTLHLACISYVHLQFVVG